MKDFIRLCAGQYVVESSLMPTKLVNPGQINNSFEGYIAPTMSGGEEATVVVNGIRRKFHKFDGGSSIIVSGNPRVRAAVSTRGGGGGGSARWNYGEYGGSGGSGGLRTAPRYMPRGTNTITVGGGGSRSDGGCGATGGQTSAFGVNGHGGAGGCWTGSNYGSNGSGGDSSVTTPPQDGQGSNGTWGVNQYYGGRGGGGGGGRWWDNTGPPGLQNVLTGSAGEGGRVVVSYRVGR